MGSFLFLSSELGNPVSHSSFLLPPHTLRSGVTCPSPKEISPRTRAPKLVLSRTETDREDDDDEEEVEETAERGSAQRSAVAGMTLRGER